MAQGNNIIKSVGAILVILVAFVSLQREFRQKLEFAEISHQAQLQIIRDEVKDLNSKLANDDVREVKDAEKFTQLSESFVSVDTKLEGIRALIDSDKDCIKDLKKWQTWWYVSMPTMDAKQDERLKAIERVVFTDKEKGGN